MMGFEPTRPSRAVGCEPRLGAAHGAWGAHSFAGVPTAHTQLPKAGLGGSSISSTAVRSSTAAYDP